MSVSLPIASSICHADISCQVSCVIQKLSNFVRPSIHYCLILPAPPPALCNAIASRRHSAHWCRTALPENHTLEYLARVISGASPWSPRAAHPPGCNSICGSASRSALSPWPQHFDRCPWSGTRTNCPRGGSCGRATASARGGVRRRPQRRSRDETNSSPVGRLADWRGKPRLRCRNLRQRRDGGLWHEPRHRRDKCDLCSMWKGDDRQGQK